MTSTVLLIGTLDTKGAEIAYLRDKIRSMGPLTLVLDSGILGEPMGIKPDIPRDQVAKAGGSTLEWLRNSGNRASALAEMAKGVRQYALALYRRGRVQGVMCVGGADGALLGAEAMKALPIGVPKVLITPMASGKSNLVSLLGNRDVMLVHSVTETVGINPITSSILDNAAGAMVGMVKSNPRVVGADGGGKDRGKMDTGGRTYVGITMYNQTARAVMNIRDRLAEHSIETVIFPANGVGGPTMEEFAEAGMFAGVIDYTTNELSDQQFGSFREEGARRLERVGALGLPQVVVPGCLDFMVHGARDEVPARFRGRPAYSNSSETTLVRLTRDEMQEMGQVMARKLNKAIGPLSVVVPTRGLSVPNVPGGPFWDPDADLAFLQSLLLDLRSGIPIVTVEAHINDQLFSDRVADEFLQMVDSNRAAVVAK
jgi:uncharacterized protein (UPF0261 family)